MTTPTFVLYRKPTVPKSEQDKRVYEPPSYIGSITTEFHCLKCDHHHVNVRVGIIAHTVTEGEGKNKRSHFEGRAMPWQELIRDYVAKPTPAKGENYDLVEQAESQPFDDDLSKVGAE